MSIVSGIWYKKEDCLVHFGHGEQSCPQLLFYLLVVELGGMLRLPWPIATVQLSIVVLGMAW